MNSEIILLAVACYLAGGLAWTAFDHWLGSKMAAEFEAHPGDLSPSDRERFKRVMGVRARATRAVVNITLWPIEFAGYVWFFHMRPGRANEL